MLTILEAIRLSTEFLEKKDIESPRINAELLLAYALKCRRLDLYLSYDRPLKEDEINLYREFIRRRSRSEPLQYIIGKVEFYGLEFKVNPFVLIPRPETEILVETIIETSDKTAGLRIIDIGTGSGNIAVSLARHLPDSVITATDISIEALNTAEFNAVLNNVADRINFINHNILTEELTESYDIIVSNPPYISGEEFPGLKDELKVYEPKNALTDFADGLNYFRTITKKAACTLKTNGRIFFESGSGQAPEIQRILKQNNFSDIRIIKDYLKIDRVVTGVKI